MKQKLTFRHAYPTGNKMNFLPQKRHLNSSFYGKQIFTLIDLRFDFIRLGNLLSTKALEVSQFNKLQQREAKRNWLFNNVGDYTSTGL